MIDQNAYCSGKSAVDHRRESHNDPQYENNIAELARRLLLQSVENKDFPEVIIMNPSANILKNNNLAALSRHASAEVVGAIKNASARTGVDFAYLMEKAAAESSFRPEVQSKSSSATGLYQFIEKTWLSMVREHGDKYGLEDYADKISAKGTVSDAKTKKEILELRKDPELSALMAAEYAADNKRYLEDHVGGDIGAVEMYLAHFLGASGANGFLEAMKNNPLDTAADIFPKAARTNRNVFYDAKTGEPRTLAGVYDFFEKKFENSKDVDTSVMIARNEDRPSQKAAIPSDAADHDTWIHNLFSNTQVQQMRLLAGSDDNDDRMAGSIAMIGKRAGNRQAMMVSPVEVMMMAKLEAPVSVKPRYNE